MVTQDVDMNKQDKTEVSSINIDAPEEILLQPLSTTLVVPATLHPAEVVEMSSQSEEKNHDSDFTAAAGDMPHAHSHHNHTPLDGHDDVDNEQPFGWVVVAAAFFVQAIVIGTVNGYGVYQDRYITHEYNTSSTFQLSWVGTLNVVGMDLSGPLTGQVADHFGYRISCFIGAIIMGASLIATSRRGFATGVAVAGGGFGGLVISPATTAMFSSIGYRWTVRTIAFMHFAIVIPAAILFKARVESGRDRSKRLKRERLDRERTFTEQQEKQNQQPQPQRASVGNESQMTLAVPDGTEGAPRKKTTLDFSVLKEKRFFILVLLSFFVANGYFNPYYFFPTYVQKHAGSVSTASLLVGILNGSSAVGRVVMGLASDHIGDVNTLLISSLCASLSILVVWMLAGSSIPTLVVFCVLYGFFSGSFIAIVPTVAAHLCGISRLASVTGIVYGGIAVGTLIGSPVGGALLDLSGGVDYKPLQLWAGLVMAIGAALTLFLKFMLNPRLFGRI
ncbi:hypothetical protein EDD11_006424 [Mortierella claussenii]|nr:hypothetical protein EDD11_006424 [Mortierella claussenii]